MRPSFDTLYRDHRARLVRRACNSRRFAFDRDVAEDIVQVALLKAWEALPAAEFGPDGRGVTTWLNTILDNAAKDYLRHNKRRPTISFRALAPADVGDDEDREAMGIAIAMGSEVTSPSKTPKKPSTDPCEWEPGTPVPVGFRVGPSRAESEIPPNVLDFNRAAAKLSKIQRAAVELKHAGYTFGEIGAAQNCTPDAARDRVRRARATLMDCAA